MTTITDWIPGIERLQITGCTGPNITQFGEWSVTFHTLEGSIATALRLFAEKPCYCPHLTISPKRRRAVQHIPLSWPAAALNNDASGVETNRAREIQIEIEGFAAESHTWPDEDLEFIGWVLAKVVECVPAINLDNHPRFVGQEAGWIARKNAPQRMSAADWYAFDGVCGHQHVPENDHWDPGRLDIDTVVRHAHDHLGGPPAPPTKDWFEMATEAELEAIVERVVTRHMVAKDARDTAYHDKSRLAIQGAIIDSRDDLGHFIDERTDEIAEAVVDERRERKTLPERSGTDEITDLPDLAGDA